MLRKIADSYDRTDVSYFLRAVQPIGVFLAAAGLAIAAWAVKLSLDEMAESRQVREAALFLSLMERLDAARALDSGRSATYEHDKDMWRCTNEPKQLKGRAGQVAVLERMNKLGIDLRDIKAHNINLVVRRSRRSQAPGILLAGAELIDADLRYSNLQRADLSGANLLDAELDKSCLRDASLISADLTDADAIRADFRGANLTDAALVRTRLIDANFWNADFSGAKLTDADVTGAHLKGADNLTQPQLDQACANPKKGPPTVPKGRTWKVRDCP